MSAFARWSRRHRSVSNSLRRILAATALLACVAPLPALSEPARAAAAAGGDTAGLAYVALGDSYSSGYGLTQLTDRPVPGCAQSAEDCPHQVTSALGLALTDVACSGAVTANITTTAQATGDGTAAPQDSALSSSTRIVTLTIGGNDLGFADIAAYCAAASPDGPLLTHPLQRDCGTHYTAEGSDNLTARLDGTVAPAISATVAAIRGRAPHAAVFVIGYPAIAPDAANTRPTAATAPRSASRRPPTATRSPTPTSPSCSTPNKPSTTRSAQTPWPPETPSSPP